MRAFFLFLLLGASIQAQPFSHRQEAPDLDRWMYPFNTTPGSRPKASVFGAFDQPQFDTRDAQFLVGFDTFRYIPTNQLETNYLIKIARVTATIELDRSINYDPTHDPFTCYLPTSDSRYTPDTDLGRPVQIFGAGFRNGFSVDTFQEDTPYGTGTLQSRPVYTMSHNTSGTPVDVSNNVDKGDLIPPFEAFPFGTGTADMPTGELIPTDTRLTFELDLQNPWVVEYLQSALKKGKLRFMFSSLHTASREGTPTYPSFYTKENILDGEPPTFEIEGTIVSNIDSDVDQVPDDWEKHFFSNLNHSSSADPDGDGQSNLQEYRAGTDPTDPVSALRIVEISRTPDSTRIRFLRAAGRKYAMEHSGDLKTWTAVDNPVLTYPAPHLAEWIHTSADRRFYRIKVK